MIPQADTLHTIAEVGIAVTGFAGIVAAVRAAGANATYSTASEPLVVLLGTSLATVFFCFVPEWLDAVIPSSETVWRVSLGLYGTYRLVHTGLILRSSPPRFIRWLGPVSAVIGVLQMIGAAGMLTEFHYFLYLSGLLWGLASSLVVFARVVSGSASQ